MSGIIPNDIVKFFPKLLRAHINADGTALANKIDEFLLTWTGDIKDVLKFYDVNRVSNNLIVEIGTLLEADIRDHDSDLIKRQKVRDAISTHKLRGTWKNDVKIRIDIITGLSASRWPAGLVLDDWALWAFQASDPNDNSGVIASYDDTVGLPLIDMTNEPQIRGNIYIDLGGDAGNPAAAVIQQVVDEIAEDVVPAYMRIFLGYVIGAEFFVYAGGIIE